MTKEKALDCARHQRDAYRIAFYEALVNEKEDCELNVSKLNFALNALKEINFADYACDLSDVIAMAEEYSK